MIRRARVGSLGLCVLALVPGCVADVRLEPPPPHAGAESLLIAIEVEGRETELHAIPRGDGGDLRLRSELGGARDAIVSALYLPHSLEALQLPPGRLWPGGQVTWTRRLPPAIQVSIAEVRGGVPGPWSTGQRRDAVAALRLPELDLVACAAGGGCGRGEGTSCATPCPEPPPIEPPAPPEPPEPPELPSYGSECPPGWAPSMVLGVPGSRWCDPPPRRAGCGPGEAQLAGSDRCVRLGAECPTEDWGPGGAPGRTTLYVRPGGSGSGSRDAPFGTISGALVAAGPGDTIALARGTYREALQVDRAVRIGGACARDTVIAPPLGAALRVVDGATLELADVRVEGGTVGVLASGPGVRVELAGVVLDGLGTAEHGLRAEHGAVIVARSVLARDHLFGGAAAEEHASIELAGVALEGAGVAGASAAGEGARLLAEGVAIRDSRTDPASPASTGHGFVASTGAELEVSESVMEDLGGYGVVGSSPRSVRVERAVVRRAGQPHGGGIFGGDTAVEVTQVHLLDAGPRPLWIVSSTASATDVVISGGAGGGGYGIAADDGASLAFSRVAAGGWTGEELTLSASTVIGRDLTIQAEGERTLPCVYASRAAVLDLTRSRLEGCSAQAVLVEGGASARLEDTELAGGSGTEAALVVRDGHLAVLRARVHGRGAGALAVDGGAAEVLDLSTAALGPASVAVWAFAGSLELERAAIDGCGAFGLAISRKDGAIPGNLRLADVAVSGCAYTALAAEAGRVEAARVTVEGGGDFGIAINEGAELEATDVRITGLRSQAGIAAYLVRGLVLQRFHVEAGGARGVSLIDTIPAVDSPAFRFSAGVVRGHDVGLVVTPGPRELWRLLEDVSYAGNDVPLLQDE